MSGPATSLPDGALRRFAAARAGAGNDTIPARAPGRPVPLTAVQRRLWFLDQAGLGGDIYLMWWAYRLTGQLDPARLASGLRAALARHELLRTGVVDGGPDGPVWGPPVGVDEVDVTGMLEQVDLSRLPATQREQAAREWVDAFLHRGFDLARPPLLRAGLVRLGAEDHVLALNVHHIACDAAGLEALAGELLAPAAASLPEPRVGFLDYAAWLADREDAAASREYWREQLRGVPTSVRLPFDHPLPARPNRVGSRHAELLPADLSEQVRALARRERSTVFAVLLAALAGVLVRFGADEDLVIGAPASTRNLPELEQMVGMFANTIALRTDLRGDPRLSELLRGARRTLMGGLTHATFPFEELVELASGPGVRRDLRRNPLCQVMLVMNPAGRHERPLESGLLATGWPMPPFPARFDLTLVVNEAEQLQLLLDYPVELFEPATVARLNAALRRMLVAMVTDAGQRLSQVRLVTPPDGSMLVAPARTHPQPEPEPEPEPEPDAAGAPPPQREPDAAAAPPPVPEDPDPVLVTDQIAQQAAARPDAPAVICDGGELTYRQLLEQADELAARLRSVGVGPGEPVGVALPTGPAAVAAILAVHRAGGAYLPLDPAHPAPRRAAILAQAQAAVVVTADGVQGQAGSSPGPVRPADPAYVIFTSGSTGRPKGVVVTHRTLSRLTTAFIAEHGFDQDTRLLMLPPVTFDASVGDLFPVLASGGALVLHPEPARLDGPELVRFTTRHQVSAVDTSVALWRRWVDDLAAAPPGPHWPVTTMMVGGDRVPVAAVRQWQELTGARVALFNHYGPTEATVCATIHRAGEPEQAAGQLPIGRPLTHVRAYVLDRYGQLAPVGVVGELYLGGDCLALGYLGQPALTAARFRPDPFVPGARMYRTGDLARMTTDHRLEFHGRIDRQVKVHGHRVEPAEAEAALQQHPQVSDAVVTADESRLVAYLAVVDGAAGEVPDDLRGFLRQRLPDYLVPAVFVAMERIPRTSHGKVDQAALPPPPGPGPRADSPPPVGPVETALAQAWARALGVPRVGRTDNFFDLGGHSLLAAGVMSEVERQLGVSVPIPMLFETADLADLADAVTQAGAGAGNGSTPDLRTQAVLPADIRPPAGGRAPAAPRPQLRAVLVTGATGFLGSHLVAELLARTPATIWCLARAADAEAAAARVHAAMAGYGLVADPARIVGVAGDLAEPGLGLSAATRAELAGQLDLICHNGGVVNFIQPYQLLRPANVDGTVAVLRLAAHRGIPVHFVSTLGVFLADTYRHGAVGEQDTPDDPAGLHDGYNQTKWVADALARQARARGIPVWVHRPARVGAHSRTGIINPDDWFCRILATCVQVGMVPDLPYDEDISPVDFVAAAIAQLAATGAGSGTDHHYFNRAMISYPEIAATLAGRGFPVELVEWAQWRAAVLALIEAGQEVPLGPLQGWLAERVPHFIRPEFDCSGTEGALAAAGIACPPADRELVGRLVDQLAARGRLRPAGPAPPAVAPQLDPSTRRSSR